jgi:hypothetical protein
MISGIFAINVTSRGTFKDISNIHKLSTGVLPVRQHAHCVTASHAEKPADPDEDPTCFNQTADLARVHAVPHHLQNAFGIPDSLAASNPMRGTKVFQSRT